MTKFERGGIILRLLGLLVFLGFLALLYVLREPLLRLAASAWIAGETAEHADAILVLGDDNYTGDRALRAADLYRAGFAPQVVASGRMLRPYAGVAEMIEHDLQAQGVPASAIAKFEHRSGNTLEEARGLRGLVATRGWKSVLVVTSDYHTRRARFIFGRVLPPGVTLRVIAAHDSDFDGARWWETHRGQKIFFGELLGFVVAWWELRNDATVSQAALSFRTVDAMVRFRS